MIRFLSFLSMVLFSLSLFGSQNVGNTSASRASDYSLIGHYEQMLKHAVDTGDDAMANSYRQKIEEHKIKDQQRLARWQKNYDDMRASSARLFEPLRKMQQDAEALKPLVEESRRIATHATEAVQRKYGNTQSNTVRSDDEPSSDSENNSDENLPESVREAKRNLDQKAKEAEAEIKKTQKETEEAFANARRQTAERLRQFDDNTRQFDRDTAERPARTEQLQREARRAVQRTANRVALVRFFIVIGVAAAVIGWVYWKQNQEDKQQQKEKHSY